LSREVANIKIERAGARVSEFCIELHPPLILALDLGVVPRFVLVVLPENGENGDLNQR
jgi:hypothetical protein